MEAITNGEFLLLTGQAVLDAMSDFQASCSLSITCGRRLGHEACPASQADESWLLLASVLSQPAASQTTKRQISVCPAL